MAPSTGIEPATSCSTGSRPLQGTTRARTKEVWWWCAGEDSHLHSRGPHEIFDFAGGPRLMATGLRPAGLAGARAGARATTLVMLACHAYSVFNVRSRILRAKRKRGLASPGPL